MVGVMVGIVGDMVGVIVGGEVGAIVGEYVRDDATTETISLLNELRTMHTSFEY